MLLLLAQHFVNRFAKQSEKKIADVSPEASQKLMEYDWPGNVRELQNCIERAVVLARFERLTPEDLPEKVRTFRHSHVLVAGDDPAELLSIEEVEKRYVLRVMETVRGNKTIAAQVLGYDRKTLYRKLTQFRLHPNRTSR